MIVVKVEIWPGGHSGRRSTIQELRIANISKLADVSDYQYALYEPEVAIEARKQGYVRAHKRSDGITRLLARVLEQIEAKP